VCGLGVASVGLGEALGCGLEERSRGGWSICVLG
jgi:hypothetical protein